MIKIIESLLESPEKCCINIPEETDQTDDIDTSYNIMYKEAVKLINERYKIISDKISECLTNMNSDYSQLSNSNILSSFKLKLHTISLNPVIHLIDDSDINRLFDNTEFGPDNIHEAISSVWKLYTKDMYCSSMSNKLLNNTVEIEISPEKTNNIHNVIATCVTEANNVSDKINDVRNIAIQKLSDVKDISEINKICGIACWIFRLYGECVAVYATIFEELKHAFDNSIIPINESASKEDAEQYLSELKEMIPEIRKFYDTFEYKEIIVPRKKKIYKMIEYLMGALDRKYTLKIPIYKVVGKSEEVKQLVENKFIKKLDSIVNKYPNFILMTPNYSNDSDMFIYITLKEPFGDNPIDRESRVAQSELQSQTESALTTDERNNLPDNSFGLPKLRAYPLNDEERIRKAIQMFAFCKPENKNELAKNISLSILKNNLVGKITISKDNKNYKYFPSWMSDENAVAKKKDGYYDIYNNDKLIGHQELNESISKIDFIL